MKRNLNSFSLLILIAVLLMTGGCQLTDLGSKAKSPKDMSADELPKVRAFQDGFTRKFMVSTKKVKDGYYEFRSGTGGYTMLFPEDGLIDNRGYELSTDKDFEHFIAGASMGKNISYNFTVDYFDDAHPTDNLIGSIRSSENYRKGDFEKINTKDKVIHYAKGETKFKKEDTFYYYFSLIQSKNSKQGLIFDFSIICVDSEKPCHLDLDKAEQKAKMMMKSVKFNNDNAKEGKSDG